MKRFINGKINKAIDDSFNTIINEELAYKEELWGSENITHYGWEYFHDEAVDAARENEYEVLRRRYGRPGHARAYGRCFNPFEVE